MECLKCMWNGHYWTYIKGVQKNCGGPVKELVHVTKIWGKTLQKFWNKV